MRNHGTRYELLPLRPNDHIGWVYEGPNQFASIAAPFLAEGSARSERLMYVADDPQPEAIRRLAESFEPGAVQCALVSDVYGPTGIVDPEEQRATFAAALSDAVSEGYSGIRVAADNTNLVSDPDRLAAWIRWEIVADRFMSENRVTGLCAFDRKQIQIESLRHLATLHPLSSADTRVPEFRIFSDEGSLWVEGEVDPLAFDQAWRALETLPPKTELVVDLSATALVTKAVMSSLRHLCDTEVRVTVRGATDAVRKLGEVVSMPAHAFA